MLEPALSAHSHFFSDTLERFVPTLRASTSGGHSRVAGLRGATGAFFLAQCLRQAPAPTVCLLASPQAAETFAEDLRFFLGNEKSLVQHLSLYPSWDVPAFEGISPSSEVIAAQVEGLYIFLSTATPIVVLSIDALAQRVMPQEDFFAATLRVQTGQEVPFSNVVDHLTQWGYRRVPLVEEKGEVSVRGGIIDVFPPLATQPLRLEFLGDTVESLRLFDPASQRSLDRLEEFTFLPMRFFSLDRLQAARRTVETALADSEAKQREQQRIVENLKSGLPFPGIEFLLPYLYPKLETLGDYLPRGTVVWQIEPTSLNTACENFWARMYDCAAQANTAGHFVPDPHSLYLTAEESLAQLSSSHTVELAGLETLDADYTVTDVTQTNLKPILHTRSGDGGLTPLVEQLQRWHEDQQRVFLVVSSTLQASHLQTLLQGHTLHVPIVMAWQEHTADSAAIVIGILSHGFMLPADRLVFIAEEEIFGERRHRRRSHPRPVADYLTSLSQLKAGDYVVHVDHGVGHYHGLRHLTVAGIDGDYLHLEYASGDRMYLPVERINLVQKYVGADGHAPALDRLGSQSWERVKRKTRELIMAMARELPKSTPHAPAWAVRPSRP